MSDTTPNPGSPQAIELGCRCPIIDNGRGRGYMGVPGLFVYTVGCPVHPAVDDAVGAAALEIKGGDGE